MGSPMAQGSHEALLTDVSWISESMNSALSLALPSMFSALEHLASSSCDACVLGALLFQAIWQGIFGL